MLKVCRTTFGEDNETVLTALESLGNTYLKFGQAAKALATFEDKLKIQQRTLGDQHIQVALTLNTLGGLCLNVKDTGKAVTYFQRALPISKKEFGDRHSNTASGMCNLGGALVVNGKPQQALDYLEEALLIEEQLLEINERAITYYNIGRCYEGLKDKKKALMFFNKALPIYKKMYGDKHKEVTELEQHIKKVK